MPWTKPHRTRDGRFDPGQVGLVKMYQKYAGIPNQEYRELLRQYTGHTTSTAPQLTQYDFDVIMPVLEIRAHLAEANERAVGKKPSRIRDWYYWRHRCPKAGQITSREQYRILALWDDLKPHLAAEHHDSHEYLCGIAAHACGRRVAHIHELRSWQALALIEALKDRLKYAVQRGA